MKNIFLTISILMIFSSAEAHSLKKVVDGDKITLTISRRDINRIKLVNDKIKTSHHKDGEVKVIRDKDLGDLYLQVKDTRRESLNIFIVTEKGFTYRLFLQVRNIPAAQAVLYNPQILEAKGNGKNSPYKEKLSKFYQQIVNNEIPAGYEKELKTHFWRKISSNLKARRIAKIEPVTKGYTAKIYEIKATKVPININENLFYNSAEFKSKARAISVSRYNLEPKETAKLIMIY